MDEGRISITRIISEVQSKGVTVTPCHSLIDLLPQPNGLLELICVSFDRNADQGLDANRHLLRIQTGTEIGDVRGLGRFLRPQGFAIDGVIFVEMRI